MPSAQPGFMSPGSLSLSNSATTATINPGHSNGTEGQTVPSGSTLIATTLASAPASTSTTASDKEKPRLTEEEKKSNHIASEQKRRAAIREGFDRLTELVPGLEGQGRSESVVLNKTVEFMRLKLQERRDLIAEIERIGGHVDDSFRT
ncbi:hypothetical protein Egran_01620 [Elaphomyces granulatus]|uniref:BHLH domain-containing protein n=1 Tax=Elaphomyces granulatus TaxID=519963 RepID=A0A232M2K7_9EURO|nr:hypothetical protein Egran_01620 [Elaphomyces granulatus]